MAGINKAIIVGNLGNDPEVRQMPNGDSVANFTVATSESWKDKQSGEKKELTEWHRVTAYRGLAEVIGKYLHKGSRVYVEGKLQTRKWQDQAGVDKYTTEIICRDMQMLDGKQGGDNSQPAQPQSQTVGGNQAQPMADDFDDDIPF